MKRDVKMQLMCFWPHVGQAQIVLRLWMFEKVLGKDLPRMHRSHRSPSNYSSIVINYHGHLETCWACNLQCQEDSLYPHSLTKSPHDITLRDSLGLPQTLVFCLYNACMYKLAHFWVSTSAAFKNKWIIVNRNVAWKMKLCGLNHHGFPRKTLVTLTDWWRRQVTHQRQRRRV